MTGKDARAAPRWPRFRFDEVVRVVDVTGWPEGSDALLGQEGAVMGFAPDPEMSGHWAVCVWLASRDEGVDFWEHQLESTGRVEVDDTWVPLQREPLTESFGAELGVSFLVQRADATLERAYESAEAGVRALIPLERVEWKGERDDKYHDCWSIDGQLWPLAMSSREAFEHLVSAFDGWHSQLDDGWQSDFSWWRASASPGAQCFLLPYALSCFVELSPWSDPTYHPVPEGRNTDLDWIERMALQLPPPAGYR